jgi:hypothetical protein
MLAPEPQRLLGQIAYAEIVLGERQAGTAVFDKRRARSQHSAISELQPEGSQTVGDKGPGSKGGGKKPKGGGKKVGGK